MNPKLALARCLVILPLLYSVAAHADYASYSKLIHLREPMKLTDKGDVEFDAKKWKVEKDNDGTRLFTSKAKPEGRVAVLAKNPGEIESITTYQLTPATSSDKKLNGETDNTLFFEKGALAAYTSCEKTVAKDSVGRVCVTATQKLCQSLRTGDGITPEILKEMDALEMRALALVLTLRGPDHQLENVVQTGNRLGLKTALQTTKGQLMALARQVAKENGTSPANEAPSDRMVQDDAMAKQVLETSVPRLRQACLDTKLL